MEKEVAGQARAYAREGVEATEPMTDEEALTIEKLRTFVEHGSGLNPYNADRAVAIISALETENAQHVNAIECLRQERDELVLALTWCKPRLKHKAYQKHVEWTLEKYPKPPKLDEPAIVKSTEIPDYRGFCQSDPLGPGRTGGE